MQFICCERQCRPATWVNVCRMSVSDELYALMFTGSDSMLAINLPYVENISVPPEITEATLNYVANDWCKINKMHSRISMKVMVSFATLVFNIAFISCLKPLPVAIWGIPICAGRNNGIWHSLMFYTLWVSVNEDKRPGVLLRFGWESVFMKASLVLHLKSCVYPNIEQLALLKKNWTIFWKIFRKKIVLLQPVLGELLKSVLTVLPFRLVVTWFTEGALS